MYQRPDHIAHGSARRLVPIGVVALGTATAILTAAPAALALALGLAVAVIAFPALRSRIAQTTRRRLDRAQPGDPDVSFDLDAVAIDAVVLCDRDILAHLNGGFGQRRNPVTGEMQPVEGADVTITWTCGHEKDANRLADQLNAWQARGTLLRLIAAPGRCTSLIEDEQIWIHLPAMRVAA